MMYVLCNELVCIIEYSDVNLHHYIVVYAGNPLPITFFLACAAKGATTSRCHRYLYSLPLSASVIVFFPSSFLVFSCKFLYIIEMFKNHTK